MTDRPTAPPMLSVTKGVSPITFGLFVMLWIGSMAILYLG